MSGTSMAAPHVTGALLRHLSQVTQRRSPEELKEWVVESSTINRISLRNTATPNKLLYAPCDVSSVNKDSAMSVYGNWFLILVSTIVVMKAVSLQ